MHYPESLTTRKNKHIYFCVFVCAIQISFWSRRKPEINRSQSVFRGLDRQFCFKTSKHRRYSTFRAHRCLSDIYERQKGREKLQKAKEVKKRSRMEWEWTGLFLTTVKDVKQRTKTYGQRVMELEKSALFSSPDNGNWEKDAKKRGEIYIF